MGDMWLSELYGKEIITNTGRRIGTVEGLIVDFEKGALASMLLVKPEMITRAQNTPLQLAKNSVKYDRVKSVDQTIIVSDEAIRR
jgi:sporulation protein YlmC with PRC-barrel domain